MPKRILISRTDRLGDVILTTPVIRVLRKEYPDAFISMMVRPYTVDLIKDDPDLDEVIVYDKYGSCKSLLNTLRFAFREIRSRNFDIAIAFHPTNRVHLMFFAAAIPLRIGYDKNMGFLLNKKIPHSKNAGQKHEVEYNLDLLVQAGICSGAEPARPVIVTGDNEVRLVDRVLSDNGIKEGFISIHPGASCVSKRWPVENFLEVARKLRKLTGRDILLIGGPETEKENRYLSDNLGEGVYDLTDNFRIGELAEVLKRSSVLISNDSGPVHIASGVKTPVVVIFGRNDDGLAPVRWKPVGEEHQVLHDPPGCDPCLAHECDKDFICLKNVHPQDVIEKAENIIAKEGLSDE